MLRRFCMHKSFALLMVHLGLAWSARTTFEKLWRSGHLMVPSWSAAPSSMCSAILVAVGRHWSLRSLEATSLHMYVGAHVLVPWSLWPRLICWRRASSLHHVGCCTCITAVSLISRLDHVACLACISCAMQAVDGPSETPGGP